MTLEPWLSLDARLLAFFFFFVVVACLPFWLLAVALVVDSSSFLGFFVACPGGFGSNDRFLVLVCVVSRSDSCMDALVPFVAGLVVFWGSKFLITSFHLSIPCSRN